MNANVGQIAPDADIGFWCGFSIHSFCCKDDCECGCHVVKLEDAPEADPLAAINQPVELESLEPPLEHVIPADRVEVVEHVPESVEPTAKPAPEPKKKKKAGDKKPVKRKAKDRKAKK